MSLQTLLEAKLFLKLAESREQDLENLHIANEVFENIVAFIRKLKGDTAKFSDKFYTDDAGRFKGFHLTTNLPKSQRIPEVFDLFIEFVDRGLNNIKPTIKAKARRVMSPDKAKIEEFHIQLFIDVPEAANKPVKAYNEWFASNLLLALEKSNYRSSFVHEFTHTLDFRRINPNYLIDRAKRKLAKIQAGVKKDFGEYTNDPLELNAYYQQALSDFHEKLLEKNTVEEWNDFVGRTPQEFAENILSNYLRPQVIRGLTPENKKRFMKRLATTWEYLRIS